MSGFRFSFLCLCLLASLARAEATLDDERIAEREQRILGNPPKIKALPDDQFTESDRALVSEMHRALDYELDPENYKIALYFATMLRHHELLKHQMRFSIMLFSGELPARYRELAILRVAWLAQAPYEWSEHVLLGKKLGGLSSAEIDRVTHGSGAAGWSKEDRTVLQAVEEMHADAMIAEGTWVSLTEFLNENQMLELPMLVGLYQGTAYLQNSIGFPLDRNPEGLRAR